LPNLGTGLSNIYKSLREGGIFAAAVLASSDKVPFISLAFNTVLKKTNSPPPPADAPGPFSLSDEKFLRDSFIKSRFKDVSVERLNMIFDFDSAEAYTNFVCETAAPVQTILSKQSQEKRKEVLRAITEATKKYADKNTGKVKFENESILIVGKK
jgi:hypothetical protein